MASRNCSFCGKELTDAASMNVGIGPVCRKMQNHVLAQLIPADVGLAQYCYRRLNSDTFLNVAVEAHKTYALLADDLVKVENKDWREVCKRIEWMLSFSLPKSDRDALISIVDALGYVSLASLLLGEAAKGQATITFEAGRLYIRGPRNKAGRLALREVKGRKFHPKTGTQAARWSVPAEANEEFRSLVWKHWPNNKGLDESVAAAQLHTDKVFNAEADYAEAVVAKPQPQVTVTQEGKVLKIASPYNKEFITSLKAEIESWKERRWNPSEKVWEVAAAHAELVQSLVAKHYGEQVSL